MGALPTIRLASNNWEAPDTDRVRFVAHCVGGSIGQAPAAAELSCLLHVPAQPRLPKYIPYGILNVQEGGFLRKKLTYRHVLNQQLMPDVWTNARECEMSLLNAVNIAGAKLESGFGEQYDLTVADGEQRYSVTHRLFRVVYYDQPALLDYEAVRAVIMPFDEMPFEPVPVVIYGYMQGNQQKWELRLPGWLDTFAVLSGKRQAEDAADGLAFHIGNAVITSVMAKLAPDRPDVVNDARQKVGLVSNFGRIYSGMEPLRIQ